MTPRLKWTRCDFEAAEFQHPREPSRQTQNDGCLLSDRRKQTTRSVFPHAAHHCHPHSDVRRRCPACASPRRPRRHPPGVFGSRDPGPSRRASPRPSRWLSPLHRPTVLALDFDGVVCDSEPESSISGWSTLSRCGPRTTRRIRARAGGPETHQAGGGDGLRNTARAVIEDTGGCHRERLGRLMPELMERWQLDRAEVADTAIRDDWMGAGLDGGWRPTSFTRRRRSRGGEPSRHADVFVVTTKQARCVGDHVAKGEPGDPPERLFRRPCPAFRRRRCCSRCRRTPRPARASSS